MKKIGNIKYISLLLLLVTLGFNSFAQERYNSTGNRQIYKSDNGSKGFDANRLIYGGGLSLSFGSLTSIGVSPLLGYRFNDWFAAGITAGYQYMRISDQVAIYNYNTAGYSYYPFKSNIFSGSVWMRQVIFGDFFLQEEFEQNFMQYKDYSYNNNGEVVTSNVNYTVPCLLLGAGYRMRMTENISMVYYIFYDALQNIDHNTQYDPSTQEKYSISPYAGSVNFKVGINFGF